jgi:Mor family transcriptional regulator
MLQCLPLMGIDYQANDPPVPIPKGSAVDLSVVVGKEICDVILGSFRGRTFYVPKADTAQSEAVAAVIGRAAVEALRNARIRRVKATVRSGSVVGWSNRTYKLSQQAERVTRDAVIYERYVSGSASIDELMVSSSLSRSGLYAALKRQRQRIITGDFDG